MCKHVHLYIPIRESPDGRERRVSMATLPLLSNFSLSLHLSRFSLHPPLLHPSSASLISPPLSCRSLEATCSLSVSLYLSHSLSLFLSLSLSLSLFLFLLVLTHPLTVFPSRKKTIHCQYSRPRHPPTVKPTFSSFLFFNGATNTEGIRCLPFFFPSRPPIMTLRSMIFYHTSWRELSGESGAS